MCRLSNRFDQASNSKSDSGSTEKYEDVGALFRAHGQEYIRIYKPNKSQIKFIKDVSKCKTPSQGGIVISCKDCKDKTYIYKSCGNSQCPKCQSIKRMQWQDKLARKILKCPYQHIVFTIPHEMNYVAVAYPKLVYGALFKAAWMTIYKLSKDKENVGGTPGMTGVLHTFGSDLKHHIHLHTLVSFGGIDKEGKWVWPKRRNKIAPFRKMCWVFRTEYLKEIHKSLKETDQVYYETVRERLLEVEQKRWCVHNTPPTAHTKIIEEYLGRYICRVGVSNKKLKYKATEQKVLLQYNDYKKQEKNKPAPKAIKLLDPLIAIHQIIKHVLPPNFQKVRYFGIMTSSQQKRIHIQLPGLVKENKHTIRTLFQIVKALLRLEDTDEIVCKACGSTEMTREPIAPDNQWYEDHIRKNRNQIKNKSPDDEEPIILTKNLEMHQKEPNLAMIRIKEKA